MSEADLIGYGLAGAVVVGAVGMILKSVFTTHIGIPDRVLKLEGRVDDIKDELLSVKKVVEDSRDDLQYIRGALDKMSGAA